MNERRKMQWSFFNVWNDSLIKSDKKIEPRNHIWASEIGGAYIDRYLKMIGTQPTNPPNERAMRKFQAGNIWEWVVGHILKRAGILQRRQSRVEYQYEGLLNVTGKLDFIGGGQPDWDFATNEIETLDFPERLLDMARTIIEQLKLRYPGELPELVLEVKSQSSFMFDNTERSGKASERHESQTFHYLKGLKMEEGHLVYVCRDDCRLLEIPVYNPGDVERFYKEDITIMTRFMNEKEQPPKEFPITFDETIGKFSKNWKIEYSGYLTMLYGFKTPMEYRDTYAKKVTHANSAFKRCVNGDKMTKLNLEWIEETKKFFPNWDELIVQGKKLQELGVEVGEGVEVEE